MDRLIYTALSGMRGAMARQTTTANNLANANTTGFRAEMSSARRLVGSRAGVRSARPVSQEVVAADMAPGSVNRYRPRPRRRDAGRRPARGPGRRRQRSLYPARRPSGQPRPAWSPPATAIPSSATAARSPCRRPDSVRIANDGAIWIVPAGGDPNQPQQVDRLKLASPAGSHIQKGLDGLFRVADGGALPVRSGRAAHPAQPRRLQRQHQPDPDRHDRGEPRRGTCSCSSSPRRARWIRPPPI